jgi:hypothetical protein
MNTPRLGTENVAINTRTLRIGGQVYQLRNLARVQIVRAPEPADAGKGSKGLAWLAGIGVLFLVSIVGFSVSQSAGIAPLSLFSGIAAGLVTYIATKKKYPPRYALVLETTGNPVTALVSPDYQQLRNLSDIIVQAIEDPPESERVVHVQNVLFDNRVDQVGDRFTVGGTGNIGKVGGYR